MPPEFDLSLDLEGLETEEENDGGAKAIQERQVKLKIFRYASKF